MDNLGPGKAFGVGGLVAKLCLILASPWTIACQAPLAMGFSRQEYWSGWPFPSLGDLPDPGIESGSPTLEADALTSEPPGKQHARPPCKSPTPRVHSDSTPSSQ